MTRIHQLFLGTTLVTLILLCGQSAYAFIGNSSITNVDKNGVVTAVDLRTKQTFYFQVADQKLLSSLKVGQVVHADFQNRNVSLDNTSPCCSMVNLRSPKQLLSPADGNKVQNTVEGTSSPSEPKILNPVRPSIQSPIQAPPDRGALPQR